MLCLGGTWVKELNSKTGLGYNNTIETMVIDGGQGRVNPCVAVVFRNLTDNDAAAMIILTDQIFLMSNDQNREMPLHPTVCLVLTSLLYANAVKAISAKSFVFCGYLKKIRSRLPEVIL